MEVHLPETQESRLLAYDQWFKDQVQIGLNQINSGEFIEEEDMDTRIEKMLEPSA